MASWMHDIYVVMYGLRLIYNIPDIDSLGKYDTLWCLLSDMIQWGFQDAFKMMFLTCLVFFHVCVDK